MNPESVKFWVREPALMLTQVLSELLISCDTLVSIPCAAEQPLSEAQTAAAVQVHLGTNTVPSSSAAFAG